MRILVDIGHPGHVHFFKHAIWKLQDDGHEIMITARDKDVTLALLRNYGFNAQVLSVLAGGRFGMLKEFLKRERALFRVVRDFNPDVVTAVGGVFIAPVCRLTHKPALVFTDTEHVALDRYLTYPLANWIVTPESFKRDLGQRQVRYAGFQELAYLHPKYYKPNPNVLDELGLAESDPYVVLRFVSWQATHDIGHIGFTIQFKRVLVKTLSQFGRVFIVSESSLLPEFKQYCVSIPPHRIHDVLAYARLYLGEGATMATEAGILGTPSVYASSAAAELGNFRALKNEYELVHATSNPEEGLQEAVRLLESEDSDQKWADRRNRLIRETIDVTALQTTLLAKAVEGRLTRETEVIRRHE